MKSTLAAALLALGLAAAPVAALAQQPADLNAVIAGIGDIRFYDDVSRVDDASAVRVVRLSTLAGANQSAARLEAVVESRDRAIRYLHRNLALNWDAIRVIKYSGVSLDQIVFLSVAGDGAAILYADDL